MSDLWDSYKVRTEKNLKDHLFQSPYFTDKETDFQRAEVTYPRAYSQVGAEPRLRPSSFSSPHQDKVLCATSKVIIHYSHTWNQVNRLLHRKSLAFLYFQDNICRTHTWLTELLLLLLLHVCGTLLCPWSFHICYSFWSSDKPCKNRASVIPIFQMRTLGLRGIIIPYPRSHS